MEMFKIHLGLSPEILSKTWICVQNKFLQSSQVQVHSVYYGTESLSCLGPKEFGTSGIETIRKSWLLKIINKELGTLEISIQIM